MIKLTWTGAVRAGVRIVLLLVARAVALEEGEQVRVELRPAALGQLRQNQLRKLLIC